jgi:hypothetical protein
MHDEAAGAKRVPRHVSFHDVWHTVAKLLLKMDHALGPFLSPRVPTP